MHHGARIDVKSFVDSSIRRFDSRARFLFSMSQSSFLPSSRRRALRWMSGAAALTLVAPGLAQAQLPAPAAPTTDIVAVSPLETARLSARAATRDQKWSDAATSWREVLRLQSRDTEATAELARLQRRLQSDPAIYEGLPRVTTTVEIAPDENSAPVTTSTPSTTAPAATASIAPATAATASPRAQIVQAPAVDEADISTSDLPPLPAAPNARVSASAQTTNRATALSARDLPPAAPRPGANAAPLPANRTLSPIAFTPPTPRAIKVSKVTAAKAWPFVNQAAKALTAGKTVRALELYRRAYSIDPTNEYSAPGVGTSLIILGRFKEAAQTFRNHLVTNPGDLKTLRGLADALTFSKQYREALGVNNYIVATKGRNFDSLYQNAKIATYAGDYALSEKFFANAAGVKSDDPDFYATWGESLAYRRNPRALNAFDRALELRPNFTRATQGIADYYAYTSQFDKAVAPLKIVVARDPKNVEAKIELGNALAYSDRNAEAVKYYQAALNQAPGNAEARLGLGRALVFSGQNARGATELRRFLATSPGNVEALEALGVAQISSDPSGAIETYQTLLSRTQDNAKRAKILASIGDLQLANDVNASAQSYAAAAQLAPNDPEINLTYAQILGYQDNYAAAGPVVEHVLTLDPNNPRALALQVQVASKSGDNERAAQLASRLTSVTPANANDALALAEALREAGQRDAASALLTRAAGLSTDPALTLRIANATRDAGDYEGSLPLYNRLLTANPNDAGVRVNLARALYYNNQLAQAQAQVDQALELDPNNSEALVTRAEISLAGGTPEGQQRAAEQADAILANDPTNAGALGVKAVTLSARQQFAEAVAQFRSLVDANPGNVEARLGLARNLYYSRQVDEAISQYQEVIRRTPADTLPRLELAQIYLDRNRFSDAEALFNDVLTLQSRGVAALPAVRQAIMRGQLVRLSPHARRDSPLRVSTLAAAQMKPKSRVKLAQAASPTVGIGGDVGSSPPAATFPQGPIVPTAPDTGAATSDDATATEAAPPLIAPDANGNANDNGGITVAPITPTVPVSPAVPPTTFTTPVVPGAAANTVVSDQVAALSGLGEIRLRQNRDDDAIAYFNRALELDANSATARIGVARALRAQKNYQDALGEADKALAVDPQNLRGRVLRAQLLSDTGQPALAQQELDALIGSLPEDAPLDTLLTLVEALNAQKNYTSALQLLDVSTQLYPNETAPIRLKAETLNFAGRYDQSLGIYDQLIALDSQDADAILGKARVYNYSNRLPEAETTYRQVLAATPDNYQAQIELADVLGRRGNYPDAIQFYTLAIQGNPSDLATRVELARVQRYDGQQNAAEATLNQVLDADPRYVSALTERGILRGVQGSYAPGIADLQAALAIAPDDPTARLGLAEVQGYAGQYADSITGYRAVLASDPTNIKARTELGLVLSYAGQDKDALNELDTVLTSNPTDITARLAKADILGRSDRTAEAVRIYNDVLSADPRNARARSGLADTYVAARRYQDAIKVYDALLAEEPSNTTYRIARARALGYNRQFALASNELRAVVAAEPDNLQARLAFAEVGTNSGNPKLRAAAITEYRRLIAADASNVPARVGLGRALSYQGQNKEAGQILNAVLQTNPGNTEARVALAESQRFGGDPFGARDNYKTVLSTDPTNAGALAGLSATKRATSPSIGVSGSYYNDTNGVRLRSLNFGPTIRTRGGVIGIIAERGRFEQGPYRADRNNYGAFIGKNFGPIQANLAVSNLKYSGAPSRFLYDLSLLNASNERRRYFLGTGRRDVYESAQAVVQGITATTYRAGFTYPLARKLDLEATGVYYSYSDSNSRYSLLPAVYYRLRPTNPSLRLGVGYTYDDTRNLRNIYYTPQNYSAFAALADYAKTTGKTRYGFNAAVPFTNSTGRGGINRPADTLFGFINRDIGNSLELFANGGIVRSPDFHSDQVTFGGNLWF